jgi:hypothetical protein
MMEGGTGVCRNDPGTVEVWESERIGEVSHAVPGTARRVKSSPASVHEAVLVFSTNIHHPLSLSTNKPPHSCRPYV